MNKLCGTLFVRNGIEYDYCFMEAIQSLMDVCDYTIVVDVGSDDGTLEQLQTILHPCFKLISLPKSDWDNQHGKEKLAYFTNVAIQEADRMGFQYTFNLQADEILDPASIDVIRIAMQQNAEGVLCKRINLWQSPYLELNVPNSKMPCSPVVLRLAKTSYRSYGDGESIDAPARRDFISMIKIWHMGFVRKRDIMKRKVINMQENVFGINHDEKLDGSDIFIPQRWFSDSDLKPISTELPKVIQKWAKERMYED